MPLLPLLPDLSFTLDVAASIGVGVVDPAGAVAVAIAAAVADVDIIVNILCCCCLLLILNFGSFCKKCVRKPEYRRS